MHQNEVVERLQLDALRSRHVNELLMVMIMMVKTIMIMMIMMLMMMILRMLMMRELNYIKGHDSFSISHLPSVSTIPGAYISRVGKDIF